MEEGTLRGAAVRTAESETPAPLYELLVSVAPRDETLRACSLESAGLARTQFTPRSPPSCGGATILNMHTSDSEAKTILLMAD